MIPKPPLIRVLLTVLLLLLVLALPASSTQPGKVDDKTPTQVSESPSVFTEASGAYYPEVRSAAKEKDAARGTYEARIGQTRAETEQDRNRIGAETVFAEAELLRAQGDLESLQSAIQKYRAALALYRSLGNQKVQADVLSKLGEVRLNTGELTGALDDLSQELLLRRSIGDRRGEAHALVNIGNVYNDLGQKQEALDSFNRALMIYRNVGNLVEDPNILINIGWVYYSLFEHQKALNNFIQALTLSRRIGNRAAEARALLGMAGTYTRESEYQRALGLNSRALSINRAIGARREEAYALLGLAWLHVQLREKQKALDTNQEALRLMRVIGDRKGEGLILHGIGWIYDLWGEMPQAIDYYSQALVVRRALGDSAGEVETRHRLAECERDRGNLLEAREQIEAAISILESVRVKLGSETLRVSYTAFAQKYYEFYLELFSHLHRRNPSHGYDAAALQISERARARTLLDLLAEARADIRQGVDPGLLQRERELQKTITATTAKRIRLLNLRHTAQQAHRAEQELEALTTAFQEVEEKIRITSPRYAALTQPQPLTLQEIQQLLDADTLLLEFSLGEGYNYLWAVTPTSIKSFELEKGSLIRDTAERVYELLTARTKKLRRETGPQREARITKSDAEYKTAALRLSRMLLGPVASLGKKRLVIVSDGALQYIPFAVLPVPEAWRNVPVEKRGKQVDSRVADTPLILDHEIVYLPSASALALLRRDLEGRKPATKTVAVFADPVFEPTDQRVIHKSKSRSSLTNMPGETSVSRGAQDRGNASLAQRTMKALRDYQISTRMIEDGQPLARLPYSRKEALSIAALVPKDQQKILLDFDVNYETGTSADLGEYRFVHFATHGLLDTRYPELTGILLSLVDREGNPQANGILRLGDVYNLKMPVELVSLSACETALGKSIRGEGLVGLTRGFMYAGAPRVIASLWKVEEEATADLMKAFYEGVLGQQQLRPAAALRQAQIEMWRSPNRSAPYYWSAFVMQGEWR